MFTTARNACFSILSVLIIGSALQGTAAAQSTVGFVADGVLDFKVLEGNQSRSFFTLQRIQQSYWIFDTASGAFYFYPLDYYQAGLPPFVGRYSVEGHIVRFQATFNAGSGFSAANNGTVQGEIAFTQEGAVLSMTWVHSAISAAYVNGTGFGNNSRAVYQFRALVRQSW